MKQVKLFSIFLALLFINISYAQDSTNSVNKIEVTTSDSFYYCTLEMTGGYEQHPAAFDALMAFCNENNISFEPAGIYWNSPMNTKPEDLKWELAVYIPEEMQVKEPLKVKKWEYNLIATTEFEGLLASQDEAKLMGHIFNWISENGYTPTGPLVRRFLNQPVPVEGGWSGKETILVPVQKKM